MFPEKFETIMSVAKADEDIVSKIWDEGVRGKNRPCLCLFEFWRP